MRAQKRIKFLYDTEGNQTDVVIPINLFEKELEDFFDIQTVKQHRNTKKIPLAEVEKRFKEKNG